MYTVIVRHSVCSMKTSVVNIALRCCSIKPSIPAATGTLGPHHYAQYLGNLDFRKCPNTFRNEQIAH